MPYYTITLRYITLHNIILYCDISYQNVSYHIELYSFIIACLFIIPAFTSVILTAQNVGSTTERIHTATLVGVVF